MHVDETHLVGGVFARQEDRVRIANEEQVRGVWIVRIHKGGIAVGVVEAVERGYYESPRQCTLTELAESFGVSKDTASGILHRAERRIIKRFLGKPPF
ncbi:helix-turn-helix domain-containing protein [Haladaptatus sp. DYF46]|uniref:helix-turn-helix domain-containing protein n=1 Tax=Haladaptatus sp. DYF46 TaxID=2886041 RepID=UPI001E3C688F